MTSRKMHFLAILALVTTFLLMPLSFANSAEPPGLYIIITHPDEGMSLALEYIDTAGTTQYVNLNPQKNAWDTRYTFHYHDIDRMIDDLSNTRLVITSGESVDRYDLGAFNLEHYRNIITIDQRTKTMTMGTPPYRTALSVGLRLLLTLVIEGVVLIFMGYRQRRTFAVFLTANVITQVALNFMIEGPFYSSYWIFGYVFAEFFIALFESLVFINFFKEFSKWKAVKFAVLANAISMVIGAEVITRLPY